MDNLESILLSKFVELIKEMGWSIAIPKDVDGSDLVRGVIVGEAEYIDGILNCLEKNNFKF